MNLALEGEGKDTGFVLYRETFFVRTLAMNNAFTIHPLRTIYITILPLPVDHLPVGLDLSGAPVCSILRVGLGAGVVGEAVVGEGEDASLILDSEALAMCVSCQGQPEPEE